MARSKGIDALRLARQSAFNKIKDGLDDALAGRYTLHEPRNKQSPMVPAATEGEAIPASVIAPFDDAVPGSPPVWRPIADGDA